MKKGTIALFGFAGMTLIAGLLLSGCAHTQLVQGSSEADDGTTQITERGKTTRNEILKWFGAPDRTIEAGVGGNQEVYIYETSEVRFYGGRGRERKNTLKMIWIDKDTGVVEDYRYKE